MTKSSNWMKSATLLALASAGLLFNAGAFAHGSIKPQHGGIVQMSGETLFELLVQPDSVTLYVTDEDDEVASAGKVAKLTIVYKGARSEVTLQPGAGNLFEGKGVKIAHGAKVGVMLTDKATQAKVSANFAVE